MFAIEENPNTKQVEMRHFLEAVAKFKPRITEEMINFYELFANRSSLTRL